jgi:tRNA threonylcarbamoyladenosine biosynthesis protein TsaB
MILLTIDTSGLTGSLALTRFAQKQIHSEYQVSWDKKAMHSELATVQLQELLRAAAIDLRQITHLMVNHGPGSFTGLRIGVSLTKTLAYALNLPVVVANKLEILAFREAAVGKILIATKAVQNFYYVAGFHKTESGLSTVLAPHSLDGDQLPAVSAGYQTVFVEGLTAGFNFATEAKDLVTLLRGTEPRQFLTWNSVEPLYIRASEAEEKLKKRLLKPL